MTKTKAQIPKGYRSPLNTRQTHAAAKIVRDFFEQALAKNLNLEFVSGPTVVDAETIAKASTVYPAKVLSVGK